MTAPKATAGTAPAAAPPGPAVGFVQTRKVPWIRYAAWAIFLIILFLLPQYLSEVEVERFSLTIVYAIAILGLCLLTGFTGLISVGHGAFFGVGAYTTAILVTDYGVPHLVTTLIAAVVCFGVGLLAGIPALRIRGVYLALVTLSLATVFPTLVQYFQSFTGGTQGKTVDPFEPWFSGLAPDQWGYYVALVVAILVFVLVRNLVRSRVGRALIAVRDNEIAGEVVGVNLALYKVLAFGVSAMIAGIAGSLSILIQPFPFIDARTFTIILSITLLAGMVIGGAASIVGPILGALFIERAPTVIEDNLHFEGSLTPFFFGALLIALMFVAPGGLVGLFHRLQAKWMRKRSGHAPATVAADDAAFTSPAHVAEEVSDSDDLTSQPAAGAHRA